MTIKQAILRWLGLSWSNQPLHSCPEHQNTGTNMQKLTDGGPAVPHLLAFNFKRLARSAQPKDRALS